jgi:hypothetical protein
MFFPAGLPRIRSRLVTACLAPALAGVLSGCHKAEHAKPPPSIEGVSAALQRTAAQALNAPPLAGEQIFLTVQPADMESEAAAVSRAAADAGGAALSSPQTSGSISILASIPANNVEAFKAVLHKVHALMDKPSGSTRLVEVVLAPAAVSSSPTPQ